MRMRPPTLDSHTDVRLYRRRMTPTTDGRAARATRREWTGLALLLLPTLMLTSDISVLFLATPHLAADLQPGATQLLWINDVYGFLIAGFLVAMGAVGDRIGRRRLLVVGSAAFAAASVLAAFSPTAESLILARALLGVAGATLMPSALALITTMFTDPRQRASAIALWVTSMSVGITVGPLMGGALLEFFWWGSVFLLNVPVMAVVAALAPFLLPEHRSPGAGVPDLVSVLLSLATVLALVYGFKNLPGQGWSADVVAALVAGASAGWVFVRRQRSRARPLLDLSLFSLPAFSGALVLLLVGAAAVNGVEFLYPQYLQLVEGMSPLWAGLWTIPGALAVVVGSLLAPLAARRVRPGVVVGLGSVVAAAGFAAMASVGAGAGLAVLVGGLVVVQLGVAPLLVLGTDLVVGAAPAERVGSASAVSETGGELGVALGIAVAGSVSGAVYQARLDPALPDEVRGTGAEGAAQTLGGAVAAAEDLPAGAGTALLGVARPAFTEGVAVAAGVSAVLALVCALVALVFLRSAGVRTEEGAEPGRHGRGIT
ncbi:MFS transporter [Nocardiopsis nanhaiensis]